MKAEWNGTVVANSVATVVVEGNHYFPPDSVNHEYFTDSQTTTMCPWKGDALYYTLEVDGARNEDAAWYYPQTLDAAKHIEGYVAFWGEVEISQ